MCPTVADYSEQSGRRSGLFKGSSRKCRASEEGGIQVCPLKGEWIRQVPRLESLGATRVRVHACVCVCVLAPGRLWV